MRRRLVHCLLAALLVIGQAALLFHQSDVEAHSHGDRCAVCLLAHGLDHAVPSQFVLHIDKPDAPLCAAAPLGGCITAAGGYYPARAPPLHTHHS